jgi:crotonyl-CoA carboxylase/reductase
LRQRIVVDAKVDPYLGAVVLLMEIGEAHQVIWENRHRDGNMTALVSVPDEGLTDLPEERRLATAAQ